MKRFLLGLFVAVFAVTLGGCFGDPVKSDIEDYLKVDQAVNSKYGQQFMNNFERKANNVKSPEEFSKIVAEFKVVLTDIQKQYGSLKPKSDEMKPLVSTIDKALGDMSASMDDLDAAVKAEDMSKLNAASDKMMKAIDDLNKSEKAIVDLANKKGMKVYQR